MKRDRSPCFDALESRELLASGHATPRTPVVLDGTLSVDVDRSSQFQNLDGSWTTTVPVSGLLTTLGKVSGSWQTSIDLYGNYDGPDTLELRSNSPKGSIAVDFNNQNPAKPHKVSAGLSFYQHAQHLASGSGAYSHDSEAGSIELMVSGKKGAVASLVLISSPPAAPTVR